MTEGPSVAPFTYVLIPSEDASPVEERRFEGNSDEELRASLRRYFRQVLLSDDQKADMARHVAAQSKKALEKQTGAGAAGAAGTGDAQQQQQLIDHYLDEASFEIIPVTMPMRDTQYVGTSLYIDDSGAFKGLPINARASRLAQREIRGDAFLLSNYDDPALDEWRRVDCTRGTYDALYADPPKTSYDVSNKAQMAQATVLRDAESKRISESDVAAAAKAKEDGNRLFAAGDAEAAVQAYSTAVDLTEGRRDLLPNEAEATALRESALLNRSLCLARLNRFAPAATDARTAVQLNSANPKGYYRLASALLGLKEFDQATAATEGLERAGGAPADVAFLRSAIAEARQQWKTQEKKTFAKMFS